MGKRPSDTNYPRNDKDHYPTPLKPVPFLIPYLQRDRIKTFAEFCCGDGVLIRNIESYGFTCVYRGDIVTGQDALELTHAECNGAQVGITNPPFRDPNNPDPHNTDLMQALIEHFLDIGLACWWLLPHDFSTNKYAALLLRFCTDIVVVGRVQWIANSEHKSGYDNSCWYRFNDPFIGNTAFHNDRDMPAPTVPALLLREAVE